MSMKKPRHRVDREPWSCGYGRKLACQRLWVQILAICNGSAFFTSYCCKNCNVCWEKNEKYQKESGCDPFLEKQLHQFVCSKLLVNTSVK